MKILNTLEFTDSTHDLEDGVVLTSQRTLHAVYEVQCTKDYQLRLEAIPFDVIEAAGLKVPFKAYEMKLDRGVYLHGAAVMFGCHAENSTGDRLSGDVMLDPLNRTATVTIYMQIGGLNDVRGAD